MNFFRACVGKDVRRLVRDPAAIALTVGLPLVIGLLLRLATGGNGGTPTARLLIADHDSTFVSRFLAGAFEQGELADLIDVTPVAEAQGRADLGDGKASGLLVIPEGFADKVFKREPVTLTLLTNPAQRILPGILEGVLGFMVDAVGIGQQVLGSASETLTREPPPGRVTLPDTTVARFSTTINRLVESAQPYLFPPAIKVETVNLEAAKDEDTFNFGTLFFPGLFFMAVIFGAQSLSDDFWKERLQGTLRRTVTTPQPLWVHLAGKVAAGSLLLGAVIVGGVAVGLFVFSIPLSDVPLAMVWAFLSGAGMLLFFTIIQISAASQRGGNLLSSAILFPLIMLGGSFFPFEAMPAWMARIGRLTPNGWILVRLKEIFAGTVDPGTLLISVIGLLAGSTILFLLCLARLRAFVKG